jgi:hypothetical protein
MESAGAKLANTAELIEIILLNLPLPNILLAQRVSWTFRNVVSSSPQLQQALFFKPISTGSVRFKHDWGNILDCASKGHCDRDKETVTELNEDSNAWIWSDSGRPFKGRLLLNPWLGKSTPLVPTTTAGPFYQQVTTSVLDLTSDKDVKPSFARMLFTQPPIVELVVDHGAAKHWHSLKNEPNNGLTGDDVVKNVQAFDTEWVDVFRDGCFRRLCYDTEHPKLLTGAEVLEKMEAVKRT